MRQCNNINSNSESIVNNINIGSKVQDVQDDEFNKKNEILTNIYNSWKSCAKNYIIISHINNSDIEIDNIISINGIQKYTNISKKTTILFSDCKELKIILSCKINHIIIENSESISMKISGGIIGGIDIIHSREINFMVIDKDIFYLSYGDSKVCNTYIEKDLSVNTLISTLNCLDINFLLVLNSNIAKYETNKSLFGGFSLLMFTQDNMENVELHYLQEHDREKFSGKILPI